MRIAAGGRSTPPVTGEFVTAARVVLATVAAVVASGALTACAERDMTPDDARVFTRRALEDVGLEEIRVAPQVDEGAFRPTAGESIAVWQTTAAVEGGTVHLYIHRESDRAVFLNDVSDDGGALLSDEQFAALERFRLNPATERYRDRLLVPAGVAIVLMLAAGALLTAAVVTGRARLRPRRHPLGGLL